MSPGPVPVPPVVTIRSARLVWSSNRPRSPSGSSSQIPTRYAYPPASVAAADSACDVTSTTCPGWLTRPASTNSSPVAITTTRGLGRTITCATPVAANTASNAGVTTDPARASTVPAGISSPARRTP